MPLMRPFFLAGTLLLLSPSIAPLAPAAAAQACTGCTGIGGSASASGGTCGGLVTITVNVQDGSCKILSGEEPGDIQCRPTRSCVPTVTRTWSGLAPATPLDFCVVLQGETLCVNPKPSSGSGTGNDTRPSSSMGCKGEPSNTRSFTVGSSSCGLFASAQAMCSSCEDSF